MTQDQDLLPLVLDSWDRNCRIVNSVATLINEETQNLKPSQDGMPLFHQLAHIHHTRRYFLGQLDEAEQSTLGKSFHNGWDDPIQDLSELRELLKSGGESVRKAVSKRLEFAPEKAGYYDNPLLYVQHMIWHEGWHVGLIFLALRLGGFEPQEEWEEAHVWGEWRTETW